jgi:iron complex transport system ATP-binding protein
MGRNPYLRLLQWEGQQDLDVVRGAMELTGTADLADRPVGTLSGGERQRAMVAMALAQQAPFMLLDEPTASLDLAHQIGVMDLVKSIQEKRGGAIAVAMHDLTLAAQYCDRLFLLAEGRVHAEGTPESVLTKENISKVYGADVFVMPHPRDGTPVVLPVSNGHRHG